MIRMLMGEWEQDRVLQKEAFRRLTLAWQHTHRAQVATRFLFLLYR